MPRLTEQELSTRHLGMGATDVVEACGLSPWKGAGPMRLFCEKTGIKSADDAQEEIDPDRADHLAWGHTMEPVILDWYAAHMGANVLPGGQVAHPEIPWLWASLDATVMGASRIIEIKMVASPALYSHWDVSSQDGVPRYVRAQVTIGMACHRAQEAHVVASVGGRPPHVWTVAYDAELAGLLIDGAQRFWQLVKDGTPPPLDATDATRAYLKHRYPANVDRVMREVDDEGVSRIAETRIEAARTRKGCDEAIRQLDAELMAVCGDADGIQGMWGKFTWKLNTKGTRTSRFTPGRGEDE